MVSGKHGVLINEKIIHLLIGTLLVKKCPKLRLQTIWIQDIDWGLSIDKCLS